MIERFTRGEVERAREEENKAARIAAAEVRVLEHFDGPRIETRRIAGLFGALALTTLLSGFPGQAQAQDVEKATRVAYEIYRDVDNDVEKNQKDKLKKLTGQLEILVTEIADVRAHYDEQIHDVSMTEGSLDQAITELRAKDHYGDADINQDEIAKLEGKKGTAPDLSPDKRKDKTQKLKAQKEEKLAPLLKDEKDLEKKIRQVEKRQKAFEALGRGLRTALNVAEDVKRSQQRTERNR